MTIRPLKLDMGMGMSSRLPLCNLQLLMFFKGILLR